MEPELNGEAEHVSKILERARLALTRSEDTLLRDWSQDFPGLRTMVLGGWIEKVKYPACRLTFERDGHEVKCVMSQRDYDLECIVRDTSIQNILEFLEASISTDTVPWQLSYWGVKAEKERIAKARRSS